VRDRQTVLRGQLTELFMAEAHNYRIRMSIKRPGAVSTEIFPLTSKGVGRKTRLWLSYRHRHGDPLLDGLSANLSLGLLPVCSSAEQNPMGPSTAFVNFELTDSYNVSSLRTLLLTN
jgi:hypothetical protein